jgi:hypothetical protein
MDWILDNLQIVIAIAGAIAYWLNARNKDKAGDAADYDGDGQPDNVPGGGRAMREHEQALEQEENNRRAQELIRCLRAERDRGQQPQQSQPDEGSWRTPALEPVAPPPMPVRDLRREQAEARRAEMEREHGAVLERQRGLAEQLAALEARKAEAQRETASAWNVDASSPVRPSADVRVTGDVGLLAELRNARSLKKAIVMREVLGTPAGLR